MSPLGKEPMWRERQHLPRDSALLTQDRLLPGHTGHGVGDLWLGTPPKQGRGCDGVGTHVLKNQPVPDLQLGQFQAVGNVVLCVFWGTPEAAAVRGVVWAGSLRGRDGAAAGDEDAPVSQRSVPSPPALKIRPWELRDCLKLSWYITTTSSPWPLLSSGMELGASHAARESGVS